MDDLVDDRLLRARIKDNTEVSTRPDPRIPNASILTITFKGEVVYERIWMNHHWKEVLDG